MDANSKLGPNYIPGDPYDMSKNGKVLDGIIDRHALCVVNGLTGKQKGVITRERHTVSGVERSVIDLVIMSSDMIKHIENIHVDEERVDVLTKNVKLHNGICLKKSDHNIITTKLNISWTTNKAKVMEIFNFKDTKSLQMFKEVTTKTDHLSKLIDSDKSIHLVTKKFLKRLQGFVHQCFKKIRIVEKEDKKLTEMYNLRRLLRTKSDEDSLKKLDELEDKLSEEYSERMFTKIMGEIKAILQYMHMKILKYLSM